MGNGCEEEEEHEEARKRAKNEKKRSGRREDAGRDGGGRCVSEKCRISKNPPKVGYIISLPIQFDSQLHNATNPLDGIRCAQGTLR